MQFLKVWGKNKRFLKSLNFFFTRGPPGGILKILARFLLGVYWQCRTCTMKAIKGSWLLENHTQKIRKIAHTGAKLQSFLWGRGPKCFFGPPDFSNFLPIFHLQIALAQKPYLHFHFRFFPKIPRSICLTWTKNSGKSLFFWDLLGFLFFLTNFPVCIQTYGREWVKIQNVSDILKWFTYLKHLIWKI